MSALAVVVASWLVVNAALFVGAVIGAAIRDRQRLQRYR